MQYFQSTLIKVYLKLCLKNKLAVKRSAKVFWHFISTVLCIYKVRSTDTVGTMWNALYLKFESLCINLECCLVQNILQSSLM